MVTVQIIKDKNCNLDIDSVKGLINKNTKSLRVVVIDAEYDFDERLIGYPDTQITYYEKLKKKIKTNITFLVTDVPYDNNFFLEKYENLIILSFYNWKYLTTLPKENGLLYWICDMMLSVVTPQEVEHKKITGCINDFLWEKDGIDIGMRHAGLCISCLKSLQKKKLTKVKQILLEDIKLCLDLLSQSSKWNKSISEKLILDKLPRKTLKRKSIVKNVITVLIASPSDAQKEREILLEKLDKRFLNDMYEKSTGYRVISMGWEQLASQTGYPQDIINELILPNVDIVIGILKHKLGTPTRNKNGTIRAESGTAEELYYALEKNPDKVMCMLYVYPEPPAPSLEDPNKKQIEKDWLTLKSFKKKIQNKVIYKAYSSENELLDIVLKDLANNIITHFK